MKCKDHTMMVEHCRKERMKEGTKINYDQDKTMTMMECKKFMCELKVNVS